MDGIFRWTETYQESPGSLIDIDGLVDGKVGISDSVSQQVRTRMVVIVLAQDAVVIRHNLILVLFRILGQIGNPLGLRNRLAWDTDLSGRLLTLQSI